MSERPPMYDIDAILDAKLGAGESYAQRSAKRAAQQQSAKRETEHRPFRKAKTQRSSDQPIAQQQSATRERAAQQQSTKRERAAQQQSSNRAASSCRSTMRRKTKSDEKPKSRSRKLRIVLVAAVAVVVIAAGSAFGLYQSINGNLHAGLGIGLGDVLVKTDMANEPFYILLLGTDESTERTQSAEYGGGGYRSDTILLVRIDAPNKKATLLSIHRDTRVDMGEYGVQKINAAHALGGPELAVEQVSQMAGVPISHYAEVNFDAFREMVDALDGVEVDVPVAIDDAEAGGKLSAGLQTLTGDQALILCRSRHTYEGTATDPDAMRAANQRLVLSAIARKVLDSDIGAIANAVRLMSEYVTTDLNVDDLVGLAQVLQGMDSETDIYSAMEPVESLYEDGTWYTVTKDNEWRAMMKRVDEGLPPTETGQKDEATGTIVATAGGGYTYGDLSAWVDVKNGTAQDGLAAQAASLLKRAGFVNVSTGNANADNYTQTLVVYEDDARAYEVGIIIDALGQGTAQKNDGEWLYDGDYLVIIGSDWSNGAKNR